MSTRKTWDFEKVDTQVKAALGLGALLIYGVVRVTINAFYDRLGLTAETVGIGQAEILGRAAVYLGFFVLVAAPIGFALAFIMSRVLPAPVRTNEAARLRWSFLLFLVLLFPSTLIFLPSFSSLLRRSLFPSSLPDSPSSIFITPSELLEIFPMSLALFAANWIWIVLLVYDFLSRTLYVPETSAGTTPGSTGASIKHRIKSLGTAVSNAVTGDWGIRNYPPVALIWFPLVIVSLEFIVSAQLRSPIFLPLWIPKTWLLNYVDHRRLVWGGLALLWLLLVLITMNVTLSRAQIDEDSNVRTHQFLRKPGTIAAVGLMAFTTLLLAQVQGEYLATDVQYGFALEGSRYGLLAVRADHVCLSWPHEPETQQGARRAGSSQRSFGKLAGSFIYLGKSGDDLVVYDFLRLATDDRLMEEEQPGQLLRIPRGDSIITHVELNTSDIGRAAYPGLPTSADTKKAVDTARQRLAARCSRLNHSMFPD